MMWLPSLMALARRIPLQAWLVAGVLTFAAVYHWRAVNAAHEAGKAEATETIRAANEAAKGKADEGIQNVDDCFAAGGAWNRARGVCIRPGG